MRSAELPSPPPTWVFNKLLPYHLSHPELGNYRGTINVYIWFLSNYHRIQIQTSALQIVNVVFGGLAAHQLLVCNSPPAGEVTLYQIASPA